MARKTSIPVAAMLVAVANLLLFAPCLCCSGGGLVLGPIIGDGSAFAVDQKQKDLIKKTQQEMEAKLPNAKAIGLAFNAANLLGSMMMVISGIGLLMRKPWGRMLCMAAAGFMILIAVANVAYQATTVLPVSLKLQEEQMRQQAPGAAPPAGFLEGVGYGTLVMMALFMIGYPALAFGLMLIAPVREFYSNAGRAGDFDEEFDDRFDDRRRHEDDDRRRHDDDDYGR